MYNALRSQCLTNSCGEPLFGIRCRSLRVLLGFCRLPRLSPETIGTPRILKPTTKLVLNVIVVAEEMAFYGNKYRIEVNWGDIQNPNLYGPMCL
jgi:hypothetical protein